MVSSLEEAARSNGLSDYVLDAVLQKLASAGALILALTPERPAISLRPTSSSFVLRFPVVAEDSVYKLSRFVVPAALEQPPRIGVAM